MHPKGSSLIELKQLSNILKTDQQEKAKEKQLLEVKSTSELKIPVSQTSIAKEKNKKELQKADIKFFELSEKGNYHEPRCLEQSMQSWIENVSLLKQETKLSPWQNKD
ncbi:9411_t:CDS:2 [Dentiscutata heterogama]|uniref:9411_t:CDS:1 n=1 Tax=Dentiscutata heterogama TaxID=1316150 RepID=A0ACA9KV58_9GLOM|nr:9411_t:CDS:2 [Dentiscutata heterogama]